MDLTGKGVERHWLDLELQLDLELPSYTSAFDMFDSNSTDSKAVFQLRLEYW